MSKESSVAPKERVNIKYKPATGDAKEEVELPLKLVMLGDYTMRPDDTPVEDRELISINKDNFNEVMKGHDLKLDLSTENKLVDPVEGEEDPKLAVSLKFDSLADFSPEAVVRQTPELNKLLELREALVALKGPLGNVPAFRKAIQNVLGDDAAREKLLAELTNASDKPADGE
ncbi:type VI secretion system contractile sheath small subunit [Roseibium denhamense]|uniref:Type VI secretion system protein ImpB n=1 Tax=Roseibium denhamense TaxID=76305 RepID=A0ABY1NWN5_9HYPH|nr:type VI secretion system contractile sheath small subunit [Roseibium denhamense]MTI04870.1 type VI secretion system contractile sheath small subunit [Roseibium denhamense]SMP20268.1 type VI secretion system protein ImpB [Roseibium denhamense]